MAAGCGVFLLRRSGGPAQHAEYFFFAHDDEVLTIDFDFGAGILAEQNAVAFFHVERPNLAFFADLAFAGGDDFSLLRLVFLGFGNNEPAADGIRVLLGEDRQSDADLLMIVSYDRAQNGNQILFFLRILLIGYVQAGLAQEIVVVHGAGSPPTRGYFLARRGRVEYRDSCMV